LESLTGLSRRLSQEISLKILGKERIVRIEVRGNRRIDKDAILSIMQTREGEIISPARLRADLKAIYKMGYFTDVKFDVSDTPEGRILTVIVQEKPAIREIILEDIARIKKLYTDKGYYLAKVDYSLQPITDTEVNLVLEINEGGKIYIKEINFEGNRAFKDKELRKEGGPGTGRGEGSGLLLQSRLCQRQGRRTPDRDPSWKHIYYHSGEGGPAIHCGPSGHPGRPD